MIVSLHTAKGLKGEEIMQFYSRLKRDDIDELFKAILTLKTEEDCYRFFEDICVGGDGNDVVLTAQKQRDRKSVV